jgi:hypothetical protein
MRAWESLGAVAQAQRPVGGVLQVVARLLDGLGGDGGHCGIAAVLQLLPLQQEPGRGHQIAQGGEGEVAGPATVGRVRQLEQHRVQVLLLEAQHRQLVLVEAVGGAGQREQCARLAEQVEREVGQRQVLFEHRAVPAPLAVALRQDEGAVGQAQQGALARRVGEPHHMWSTLLGS